MKHLKADFKDKTVIAEELDRLHDETVTFHIVGNQHIYLGALSPTSKIKEVHLFFDEDIEKCYSIYKITNNFKALKLAFCDTQNLEGDFSGFELEVVDFYYSVYDIVIYGATRKENGYFDSNFAIVFPAVAAVDIVYR